MYHREHRGHTEKTANADSRRDHPYSISVAHYQLNSLESLKQKLQQFPPWHNLHLGKSYKDDNDQKDQEFFRQFESYLEQHGMKLERESNQ